MRTSIYVLFFTALPLLACGWSQTKMVPAADYGSAAKASISAAPSYTAGPNYVRTTSPDGSTAFVCVDGSTRPASEVPPGKKPPC